MATVLLILSFAAGLASVICFVMTLAAAADDEIWKAVVGFFFVPYLIYWAIVEDYGEGKWTRIGIWLGGGALATVLRLAWAYMLVSNYHPG